MIPAMLLLRIAIIVLIVLSTARAQTTSTAPTSAPTTEPSDDPRANRNEAAEMVTFLSDKVYSRLIGSTDWLERSLGLISLARLPGEAPTAALLDALKKDKVPAVQ